jgi:hypothetical protein
LSATFHLFAYDDLVMQALVELSRGWFRAIRFGASCANLRLIYTSHAHAIPLLCHVALIHTCYAVPLPFSDSAVSFMKVHVVAGNIQTASPTV